MADKKPKPTNETKPGQFDGQLATELLKALWSLKKGDFSVRMPLDLTGVAGDIAEAFNDVVELKQALIKGLQQTSKEVGKEGKIKRRLSIPNATGAWAEGVEAANNLITELVQPLTDMSSIIEAISKGDLTQKMSLEVDGRPIKGVFLKTAKGVNAMVDQ